MTSARIARVLRLIDAAHEATSDPELAARIASSTGLSREGVTLALAEHVELSPLPEELAALERATEAAESVHVILSANVFVAALRALAIATCAAPSVTVRPSSRDPHFAVALVRALRSPDVTLSEQSPADVTRGEIHVYGHDETVARVRSDAREGVVVRGHGAGMGVAIVSMDADLDAEAPLLARDVAVFDQRGCLSPRVVFVVDGDRAHAFAEKLHASLESLRISLPRGSLAPDEASLAERYASTVAFAGTLNRGSAHMVGLASTVLVPPSGRHVHVVAVKDLGHARTLLAPLERAVVTVGSDSPRLARELAPPHARRAALGFMQRPPLDGPVDQRSSIL